MLYYTYLWAKPGALARGFCKKFLGSVDHWLLNPSSLLHLKREESLGQSRGIRDGEDEVAGVVEEVGRNPEPLIQRSSGVSAGEDDVIPNGNPIDAGERELGAEDCGAGDNGLWQGHEIVANGVEGDEFDVWIWGFAVGGGGVLDTRGVRAGDPPVSVVPG